MNEESIKHFNYKNYRIDCFLNEYKSIYEICIFRDNELIRKYIPGLDAEPSLNEDIFVVTSDGQTWIYSLDLEKEIIQEQDIVTYNHKVYLNDMNITIVADACYWGAEHYEFNSFMLIDRLEMKVLRYIKDGDTIV